jgi:hypothetical protein
MSVLSHSLAQTFSHSQDPKATLRLNDFVQRLDRSSNGVPHCVRAARDKTGAGVTRE